MYKIVGTDRKEYGPVTVEELRQWIAEGRVNAQTVAQAEGETVWKPLGSFPDFADLVRPSPPVATAPAAMSAGSPQTVPNYLVQAILCTVCCCVPFGIVAIVYAAQVNGKLQAGDYQGAEACSKKARMWCWIAFGLGIVTTAIAIGLQLMTAGMSYQR